MADGRYSRHSSNDLEAPFLFVPHGQEPSPAWMADHPGAVRFPATFVPHGRGSGGEQPVQLDQSDASAPDGADSAKAADAGPAGDRRQAPDPQAFGAPPPPPGRAVPRTAGNPAAETPGFGVPVAPHQATPRQPRRPVLPPTNAD